MLNMPNLPKAHKMPWEISTYPKKSWSYNEDTSAYKSARWVKLRQVHLNECPYCVECDKEGVIKLGRVVDHILPVRLGGGMFDPKNLQTLCDSHHNRKSRKEQCQIEYR